MNNEQKILKTLEDFGRLPTGRIAAIIGLNYQKCLTLLDKLLKQNKIIQEKETTATYWIVPNHNQKEVL